MFLESTTEFTVDAKSVSRTGDGKVKAFVTAPSGTRTEALVNNNNDGTYKCIYTPFEQGKRRPSLVQMSIPVVVVCQLLSSCVVAPSTLCGILA